MPFTRRHRDPRSIECISCGCLPSSKWHAPLKRRECYATVIEIIQHTHGTSFLCQYFRSYAACWNFKLRRFEITGFRMPNA
jgi:hypothetical protein